MDVIDHDGDRVRLLLTHEGKELRTPRERRCVRDSACHQRMRCQRLAAHPPDQLAQDPVVEIGLGRIGSRREDDEPCRRSEPTSHERRCLPHRRCSPARSRRCAPERRPRPGAPARPVRRGTRPGRSSRRPLSAAPSSQTSSPRVGHRNDHHRWLCCGDRSAPHPPGGPRGDLARSEPR